MFQSIRPTPILILLAAAVLGCKKAEEKKQAERAPVEVTLSPVVYGPLDKTVEVVGTLYGDEEVAISAKVPGRVIAVTSDVGDRVAGGGQLAQIDPVDYQLEVARRQNALREALAKLGLTEMPGEQFNIDKVSTVERSRFQAANTEAKLERARKLFEQKPPLISEQDFADLETGYEVAKADHDVARLEAQSQLAAVMSRKSDLAAGEEQLNNTRIVTPALKEGRQFAVSQRSISVGEYVREGSALYRVVLDDRIKFRGSLPERFVSQVTVGQTVTVRVDGVDEPAIGQVSRVNPAIDTTTRTFQIEALFSNADHKLRPGAFARGTVVTGQDQKVPFVPRSAIASFAGVDKVFGVRDGKAVEYVVTLGPTRDKLVAIRTDLKGEKEVVATGAGRLANQSPVDIKPTTQPATASSK